jgi:hypothetical protein
MATIADRSDRTRIATHPSRSRIELEVDCLYSPNCLLEEVFSETHIQDNVWILSGDRSQSYEAICDGGAITTSCASAKRRGILDGENINHRASYPQRGLLSSCESATYQFQKGILAVLIVVPFGLVILGVKQRPYRISGDIGMRCCACNCFAYRLDALVWLRVATAKMPSARFFWDRTRRTGPRAEGHNMRSVAWYPRALFEVRAPLP